VIFGGGIGGVTGVISSETESRGLSENSMSKKTDGPSLDKALTEERDIDAGIVTEDALGGVGD